MQTLGEKLKSLREKSGKTQQEIATILCLNRVTYTQYENNKRIPPLDSLKKLSEIYNVTIDELTGNEIPTKNEANNFSARDQRDIKRTLDKTLEALSSGEALMFDGEPIDEETTELLKSSIENSIRMAKALAKKKYTPKKYRKE